VSGKNKHATVRGRSTKWEFSVCKSVTAGNTLPQQTTQCHCKQCSATANALPL